MKTISVKKTFRLNTQNNQSLFLFKGTYELVKFQERSETEQPYEVMFIEYRDGKLLLSEYCIPKLEFETYCEIN
jgi:hypothetical protein